MTDSAKPNLRIIVASTRPTRVGGAVGEWVRAMAEAHGKFAVHVTDIRALDLPLMDEPHHPRQQNYTKDHTKAWSADVASADAFVFVMPEYNFSFTAPLKNALDYLQKEWMHKPVGIVSYGRDIWGFARGDGDSVGLSGPLAASGQTSSDDPVCGQHDR